MTKVFEKIWSAAKRFPFVSYGFLSSFFGLGSYYLFKIDYDSSIGVLIIIILAPLIPISDFVNNLPIYNNPHGSNLELFIKLLIFLLFVLLLDLVLLYLRKCLIPAIRGKNKNFLIPNFLKVFFKSHNGKN
jgi:hypothetical protein